MLIVFFRLPIWHNGAFCFPALLIVLNTWHMTDRRRNVFQDQKDDQNEQGLSDIRKPKGSSAGFAPVSSWRRAYRTRPNTKDVRIGRPRPNRLHAGTVWWMVMVISLFVGVAISFLLLSITVADRNIWTFCEKWTWYAFHGSTKPQAKEFTSFWTLQNQRKGEMSRGGEEYVI